MENMEQKSLVKTFLSYALPCIISMLLTSFIIVVDGLFIGWKIGENGLAAINLTLPILYILLAVTILIGVGGVTLAAQSLGAKENQRANYYFSFGLSAIAVVDAAILLFLAGFFDEVVNWLDARHMVYQYVKDFLGVMLYFYLFMMLNMAFSMYIRAEAKPQLSLFFGLAGNIINIMLDYLFIVSLDFGMKGAALASGLAVLIPFLCGLGYFVSKKSRYQFCKFTVSFHELKNMVFNGAAECIAQLSISITTFLFNLVLVEEMGINGVAALTIIGYVLFIENMILTGIAVGIHPLISYHFGSKNIEFIVSLLKTAIKAVFLVGIVMFLISFTAAESIIGMFSQGNAELIQIGALGLKFFAVSFILNGYNIIAAAFFTSIGAAKEAAAVSSLRSLILIVIFLLVLPPVFGSAGIWLTTPLAEAVTFIIAYIFVNRMKVKLTYL